MPEYLDKSKGSANFLQVYFIGISMVMAGHCAFWTVGLFEGFWEFFISIMVVSAAFFCLCLCLAEMISILPFGGGSYGFTRVTMGPFLGFMVGFYDSISNIIYVSLFVRIFVLFFNFCIEEEPKDEDLPYMWLIVYIGIITLHMAFGKFNFWFIALMGLVVLAIPIIFILGTTDELDYDLNVVYQQRLLQHVFMPLGARGFIRFLPVSALLYFGIDMMCLVCEDTKNPAFTVPWAMMAVMTTLFVLAIGLLFSVACQYPGVFFAPFNVLPMNYGFMVLFDTDYRHATITVLFSFFMEFYALSYAYGRQMCALARSTLLPPMFAWTSYGNIPCVSIIAGSAIGMLNLVVLKHLDPELFEERIAAMYSVAQLCSIVVYVISILSFIVFRSKYSILKRPFNVGRAGIPLAMLGIVIFVSVGYALTFLAIDNYFNFKAFAILTGFGITYYFVYARSRQSFSQEEQSILFAVYVIKANSKHRTVSRWLEKKYNRHILKNVSTASLAIRTSLRKSTTRTKTKITPQSATRKAEMASGGVGGGGVGEDYVVKYGRVLPHFSEGSSDINSQPNNSSEVLKPSDTTRDFEAEVGVKFELGPVNMIILPPIVASPVVMETGAAEPNRDPELDQPVETQSRLKVSSHTKTDTRLDGLMESSVEEERG